MTATSWSNDNYAHQGESYERREPVYRIILPLSFISSFENNHISLKL